MQCHSGLDPESPLLSYEIAGRSSLLGQARNDSRNANSPLPLGREGRRFRVGRGMTGRGGDSGSSVEWHMCMASLCGYFCGKVMAHVKKCKNIGNGLYFVGGVVYNKVNAD